MQNNNNRTLELNPASESHESDYLHGAAIIDDQGIETPITEEMIQKALKSILKTCSDESSSE